MYDVKALTQNIRNFCIKIEQNMKKRNKKRKQIWKKDERKKKYKKEDRKRKKEKLKAI